MPVTSEKQTSSKLTYCLNLRSFAVVVLENRGQVNIKGMSCDDIFYVTTLIPKEITQLYTKL